MELWLRTLILVAVAAVIIRCLYWAVCKWLDALNIYDPSDEDW